MREGFAGREDRVFIKLIVEKIKRFWVVILSHLLQGISAISRNSCFKGATKLDFDKTIAVH